MEYESEPILESISTLGESLRKAPEIKGVSTGIKGLDELFFITGLKRGRPVRKPLGGIPQYAVINLTGVSDTGKSLMAEQFAVKRASEGDAVCFITVETTAPFVSAALRERARAMGVKDISTIDKNIIVIDAASYHRLREYIPSLLDTLAYAIKQYKIKYVVIDSITGLYESREMMARQVVRQLFNFMKKWYQTAIFVSQKRSGHEELSPEAAGGYAVAHIVDCTIVLAKQFIRSRYDESLYGLPIGELIRLFRIDGCRMCGHDTSTHVMYITEAGLVEIGPTLKELREAKQK